MLRTSFVLSVLVALASTSGSCAENQPAQTGQGGMGPGMSGMMDGGPGMMPMMGGPMGAGMMDGGPGMMPMMGGHGMMGDAGR